MKFIALVVAKKILKMWPKCSLQAQKPEGKEKKPIIYYFQANLMMSGGGGRWLMIFEHLMFTVLWFIEHWALGCMYVLLSVPVTALLY